MAGNPALSPTELAAAAFWAGRATLQQGQGEEAANRWFKRAAGQGSSFYSLLAREVLLQQGIDEAETVERPPVLTSAALSAVARLPRGARALGLLQVGQRGLASAELARISTNDAPEIAGGVSALLATAMVAEPGMVGGGIEDSALPVPGWKPTGGFTVDRALLFAVAHQESNFNAKARSRRGAAGLMQLMPNTARRLAGRQEIGKGRNSRLFVPEVNLALGQQYIDELLRLPMINGNLLLLAAAYNAGPGNLEKWQRRLEDIRDPLLFMESLPYAETRRFVARFATNFWLYRKRFGQPAESLASLARGEWPVYVGIDVGETQVAEHEVR
jgi:soluble lytic murein transglycosylase-like protein